MELLFLALMLGVVVVLMLIHRPLWQSITAGVIVGIILFRIPLGDAAMQVVNVFTTWSALSILVSLYLITLLQRILDKRQQIQLAQQDLNGLFHNRRINAAGSALFIGLLPSAAAMLLCSDIFKNATDGYLQPDEQAFATSWIRHIPESSIPTYAGVLLMLGVSGVSVTEFLPVMILPVIVLLALSWFFALRKIPKDPGTPKSEHKLQDAVNLCKHLWTLLLIVVLVFLLKLSIVEALVITLLLALPIYRIPLGDLPRMLVSAFDKKLLISSFAVLVLKNFITYTGVLPSLPDAMAALPIPPYIIFFILFFLGSFISGSTSIIAIGGALAFAAVPGPAVPLIMLLMCSCHAASQISPTHVCVVVTADYFRVPFGAMVKKTMPSVVLFCLFSLVYYNLLLIL